jgi:hypothetical protein
MKRGVWLEAAGKKTGCEGRSGFGTEEVKDAKGFARWKGKTVKPQGIAGLDDDFSGGVIVSAALARSAWNTRDMTAATGDDEDHGVVGDGEPDG